MEIKVLMSTTNKKRIEELELKKKNIKKCIIVNQTEKKIPIEETDNYYMISCEEKGLSKSRNKLIENIDEKTEVAVITDDDVSFVSNYDKIIEKAYQKFKDADIIIFKSFNEKNKPRRNYPNQSIKLKRIDLLEVCSIEITFKVSSIKNKIMFNEKFGLGSTYRSGEENIFLEKARKKGYNIYFYNDFINSHPTESTGIVKWSKKEIYEKGALFKELFPFACYFLIVPICIAKRKSLSINLLKAIKEIYKGMYKYNK